MGVQMNTYKTASLYEAAALSTIGYTVEKLEKLTERKVTFNIINEAGLEEAVQNFHRNTLVGELNKYSRELQKLKSWVYSTLQGGK